MCAIEADRMAARARSSTIASPSYWAREAAARPKQTLLPVPASILSDDEEDAMLEVVEEGTHAQSQEDAPDLAAARTQVIHEVPSPDPDASQTSLLSAGADRPGEPCCS